MEDVSKIREVEDGSPENPEKQHIAAIQRSGDGDTVDGRNPAPVDMIDKYPVIYQGFLHPKGGWPWDFSHQQY